MGTERNGRGDSVEGFRVLTLLYSLDELPSEQRERLVELFKRYRAIASLYFWSKRLGLEEGVELALNALLLEEGLRRRIAALCLQRR